MVKIFSALLFFSLLLFAVVPAQAQQSLDETRRSLSEIRERIRRTSANLEKQQSERKSLFADLKTIEREVNRLNVRFSTLTERRDELRGQIREQEEDAQKHRERIASLRQKVHKRLAALYKEGRTGPLSILFSSRTPARMAEEYDYMARVLTHDRQLLQEYRKRIENLEDSLQRLSNLKSEQEKLLAEVRASRDTRQQAQELKEQLLAKVRQDEKALAQQLAKLREEAASLQALVKKLESLPARQYTGHGDFAAQKGHLPWPAEGALGIGYGTQIHPELGTRFESQGIELAVKDNWPVHAVWDGRVVFAKWFKGYGNLAIVDHGNSYYTLYAQTARLTKNVGDPVAKGETLAYAGLPGSRGIYFEIRHGGTPVNPLSWLKKR